MRALNQDLNEAFGNEIISKALIWNFLKKLIIFLRIELLEKLLNGAFKETFNHGFFKIAFECRAL